MGDFQPDDFINDDIKIESEEAEKKEGKESKKFGKKWKRKAKKEAEIFIIICRGPKKNILNYNIWYWISFESSVEHLLTFKFLNF